MRTIALVALAVVLHAATAAVVAPSDRDAVAPRLALPPQQQQQQWTAPPIRPIPCPCANKTLCEPLTVRHDKEVFGYQVIPNPRWELYDWSRITTIALYSAYNDSIVCHAHAHNVRVVVVSTFPWFFGPIGNIANATIRKRWVAYEVERVLHAHLDGVNMDIENNVDEGSDIAQGITLGVLEIATQLRSRRNGHAQITFAVAPGRGYNYAALADMCDFLVIMDYSTCCSYNPRWTPAGRPYCYAGPNAPSLVTQSFVEYFLARYNVTSSLVLALPWSGYIWPCSNTTLPNATHCITPAVPIGNNTYICDDQYAPAFDYTQLMIIAADEHPQYKRTSPWTVNTSWVAGGGYASYNFINVTSRKVYQVWMDTPATLSAKYRYAARMGLRGVGMWVLNLYNQVPVTNETIADATAMYDALDAFLRP